MNCLLRRFPATPSAPRLRRSPRSPRSTRGSALACASMRSAQIPAHAAPDPSGGRAPSKEEALRGASKRAPIR
ncbi:hypothetical protein NDU88_009321 [Pleurodeles waltl]|uniref:Uncharacterized protein n=1 Tax=Pleurodeles waltl TaxID=8319 RepID=A0AAV7QRB8_PLEWA|nr:hypothetical protein NDU88_009321 [Pleurodeles waltl]